MDTSSKVTIICCGLANHKYEILVFIVDVSEEDGGEEMAILPMHPKLRISADDFNRSAACVLGDKLYLFDGCLRSFGDQVKGVFTFPLPEGVSDLQLQLKRETMRKEPADMNGTKVWPRAVVTPDGGMILVFSSLIEVFRSSTVDFELYDPTLDVWYVLPNLPVSVSEGPDYARVQIKSFTFMDESVFFVYTSVGAFTLDIKEPTVWRRGGFLGDERIPDHSGYNFLLIERKICVVSTHAFDIRRFPEGSVTIENEDIFGTLPYSFPNLTDFPPFPSEHSDQSGCVTLLEHERGKKFKVCFLHSGINGETKHAEFMLQVYKTYLSPCTKDLRANRKRKAREDAYKMWWERRMETLELPFTFKLQSLKIVVEEDFNMLDICSFSSVP